MEAFQMLTVCGLLCAAVVNYLRFRDLLYPPVIQASIWLVVMTLYVCVDDSYNQLSEDMYLVVCNGVFMFGAGAYVVTFSSKVPKTVLEPSFSTVDTTYSQFLFWISLMGLPLFIARAYALGEEGPTEFLLINVRYILLTYGMDNGYGVLQYLLPLSFIACGIQCYRGLYIRNRFKVIVSASSALTYAVLSTGRTLILLLCLMVAGLFAITRRTTAVRSAVYFAATVVGAFVAVGYLLQKGLQPGADLVENLRLLQGHVIDYMVGALPALDQYIHSPQPIEYGDNSLRSILAMLEKLGFDAKAPDLIQEITHVPIEFNVYTVYQPYFKDFYMIGILIVQLFLGMWHGYLYKNAVQQKPFYVFMYSLFLFPLCMQFFQDHYVSLLSMWIQFGILVAAYVYTSQVKSSQVEICRV